MSINLTYKRSGTKNWVKVDGKPKEIENLSKQLGVPIHSKGRQMPHLDVSNKNHIQYIETVSKRKGCLGIASLGILILIIVIVSI